MQKHFVSFDVMGVVAVVALGFFGGAVAHAAPVAHRVDCQFVGTPHSCYVSSTYDADDTTTPGTVTYTNIEVGYGCDNQTIYNDTGRQMFLSPDDILVPPTSMLPSLTVPAATNTAGLDLAGLHSGCTLVTSFGTMTGSCIVQILP